MAAEPVEVQLARVDERLTMVLLELRASKDSRKEQYDALDALRLALQAIGQRVENVEKQVASAAPTLSEFVAIKNKVVGAGAIGKWLWLAGGGLLGLVAGSRETILHWLAGGK